MVLLLHLPWLPPHPPLSLTKKVRTSRIFSLSLSHTTRTSLTNFPHFHHLHIYILTMHTSHLSSSSSSFFFSRTPQPKSFTSKIHQIKPRNGKNKKTPLIIQSFKCMQSPETSISSRFSTNGCSASLGSLSVAEKVVCIASEFRSLPEPIERVKRLLNYATLLPPFDESEKGDEKNRVFGCTAQVWLEVKMIENGIMKFRVDSDSEITKGFCSCLIWLLDGAFPEEVLSVKIDDLFEMNVGLVSRGYSRVNTWHNVLISMQNRTRVLIDERDLNMSSVVTPPSVRGRTSSLNARLVL